MWGVDLEVDGLPVDTLVVSCNSGCLIFDFSLYLGEIIESPSGYVQEFTPFLLSGYTSRSVWHMDFIVFLSILPFARKVDELKNKRSAGNDTAASRQEVSTDNVLEH